MKRFFLRLGEVLCVVLLAVFIIFVSSRDNISTTPFKQASEAVSSACDLKKLEKRDKLEIKRKFSLDADAFKGFAYYSSDSVMDVRELLILACDDNKALSQAQQKLEVYVKEKGELFEGYAPEESKLISSYVLTVKKGYLLFYIGEDKEKVVSAFSESL